MLIELPLLWPGGKGEAFVIGGECDLNVHTCRVWQLVLQVVHLGTPLHALEGMGEDLVNLARSFLCLDSALLASSKSLAMWRKTQSFGHHFRTPYAECRSPFATFELARLSLERVAITKASLLKQSGANKMFIYSIVVV
jgi:hypothetical protein